MNILFLTLVYPENNDNRGLYIDLIQELTRKGNRVTVITPIERRFKEKTYMDIQDQIKVLRVKTLNIQKTNLIEKGISTLIIDSIFKKAIKKYLSDERYDLILYSTPPITFEKVIGFIKKRDNAKSYLLLKDIFPQNAVDLGMIKKNSFIYKIFRSKERKLYKTSDYIGCMSKANVDFILEHNKELDKKKVEVCPNSIMPNEYTNLVREESIVIKNKYGIPEGKTIFAYGGNIGKPQGIDFLIEVLKSNKYNEKIFFVICGSGTEVERLKKSIEEMELKNTKLLPHLAKSEYDNLLKVCDVGLVFLDKRFTIPNFPSRLLSYMDLSMPIIAATDVNSDIGKTIESGNFGWWCESDNNNVAKFNSVVEKFNQDKSLIEILGRNSRKYLLENYTVENTTRIILNHFN